MLSAAALDRRAVEREDADLREDAQRVLVLCGGRLPLAGGRLVLIDRAQLGTPPRDPARPEVYLGEVAADAGRTASAGGPAGSGEGSDRRRRLGVTAVPLEAAPQELGAPALRGAEWVGLRRAAPALRAASAEDEALAVAAQAVTAWHLDHPRCPRCGSVTEVARSGWARVCPQDGSVHFPRTDPAIIAIVTDGEPGADGERVLLGRAAAWPERRFSALAGFVEPGESFEEAVVREIREESGVTVGEVRCLGSQPWPFPRSLMIGCTARRLHGDPRPDGQEIAQLRWFTRPQLAAAAASGQITLPGGISIARALIEHWHGQRLPESGW